MEPLVSIIVPVYKAEKFLKRCIDSILASTYGNYEIILVDDGSPDQCGSICDQYAVIDSRIKVFHQKNSGVSAARNRALKVAQGEYILFVDADDYISPDLLRFSISCMKKQKADILAFNAQFHDKKRKKYVGWHIDKSDYSENQIRAKLIMEDSYIWKKIYHCSIWKDLLFPVGQTYEDEYINIDIIGRAGGLLATSKVLYFYEDQNSNSITKTRSLINYKNEFNARFYCYDQSKARNLDRLYIEYFMWNALSSWGIYAYHLKQQCPNNEYLVPCELKKEITSSFDISLQENTLNKLQMLYYLSSAKANYCKYKILKKTGIDFSYAAKSAARYMIRALVVWNGKLDFPMAQRQWMLQCLKEKDFLVGLHLNQKFLLWIIRKNISSVLRYESKRKLQKGL